MKDRARTPRVGIARNGHADILQLNVRHWQASFLHAAGKTSNKHAKHHELLLGGHCELPPLDREPSLHVPEFEHGCDDAAYLLRLKPKASPRNAVSSCLSPPLPLLPLRQKAYVSDFLQSIDEFLVEQHDA